MYRFDLLSSLKELFLPQMEQHIYSRDRKGHPIQRKLARVWEEMYTLKCLRINQGQNNEICSHGLEEVSHPFQVEEKQHDR